MDAAANGYARAEAVGVLVLQLMASLHQQAAPAATSAARPIAVICGSAVNQDGRSSSLTAPNGPSQQAVIRAALLNAGLTAADVLGVSMHGTGKTGYPQIVMNGAGDIVVEKWAV